MANSHVVPRGARSLATTAPFLSCAVVAAPSRVSADAHLREISEFISRETVGRELAAAAARGPHPT